MKNKPIALEINRGALFILLIFFFLISFSTRISAQTLPTGFTRVAVASGLSSVSAMAFAPDGRIFVCMQLGQLRVIKGGNLLATPFMTLSVSSSGERGLIGITLDPNFSTNNYVYVYYTLADGSRNRVSRFTANGDVVLAGSEVVVLNLDPLGASNHQGGALKFGPDGKLYIGIGDNNVPNNAQLLDSYMGKILRVNPDGSVPAGNPFNTGSEQRKRIWAYGLRNPFTMNFQPGTGKLFINDVGQTAYEEINDGTVGGRNFGWPLREGPSTDAAYVTPVYSYKHLDNGGIGCCIAGGTFYNPASTNWPSTYVGKYFFMDYCTPFIQRLDISGATAVKTDFASNLAGPLTCLEVGLDGNLYYHNRNVNTIYKIIYTLNNAPTIATHPSNVTVSEGQPASFSVTATGAAPLAYQWQKGGVNIAGATSATYTIGSTTPSHAGSYRALVSNSAGSATSNAATLTVTAFNAAPTATISTPSTGAMYRAGETITFSGTGTDPEDGTLTASAFSWKIDFHHDTHTHPALGPTSGTTGSFTVPTSGEQSSNVWYRLYLTVTDSKGLASTKFIDILPHKTNISFVTQPAGLQIALDGQPTTTPLTVTSVEGLTRSIGMITQTSGGVTYEFDKWLHGGTATQNITTPLNDITYTAVYKAGAVNLALNKPVTVSSIEATGLEGPKAVDGSATTRWASLYTDPQWLYVDLGATYDINRVKIVWEAAYATNYEVQISSNATTWTPIKVVTANTTLNNDWTTLSGTGRYIRIYGTARGTVYGYSIFELEVYGTPGCTVPAQPGVITGNTSVTSGSSQTYSVAAVNGATSYIWTLPSGWSGTSTTASITATAGTTGGTISVKANNTCGASAATTLAVTITCPLPAQPGAIAGNASVTSGSSQTYSVAAVSGATSYIWTLPSGWSGTSTTASITATAGATGSISVKANNTCGASAATTLAVTVNCTMPAQPGAITGNTTVASGSSQTYSVAAVNGATSYIWTLPSGWSGTSTTASITATAGAAGGTISVKATNTCGSSAATTLAVTVTCTAPAQPGAIAGNASVTSGSSQTYSVAAVSGATSYTWTLPTGWSGTSTTASITTTVGSSGGTISVIANNTCGSSAARTLAVTIAVPSSNLALMKTVTVSSIEPGTTFVGANAVDGNVSTRWSSNYVDPSWIYVDLAASYNVDRVKIVWEAAYSTAYVVQISADAVNWQPMKTVAGNATLVNDWTGLTGTGRYVRIYGTARNSQWGHSIFELEVYGTSGCTLPAQPGAIAGNTSVTSGSSQTYSVAAVSGATSYTWTLPSGWSGTSTSTSIIATAGITGGIVSVKANNTCGASAASNLSVIVPCTLPAQPGAITGNTTVASGSSQVYSVAAVSGATSYTWTLPSGWSGTTTSASITAIAGITGGTISVKANNTCGTSAATNLAVTVTCTMPAQPGAITGNTTVASGSSQTYSVAAVSGATSYTWTMPSGWSGTSTSASITATAGSTGTISVIAKNACGSSPARTLAVTVTVSSNLALNKMVTVSSIEPGTTFVGSNAVDGSVSTRWSSNYIDPSWIYVDLGATYDVNRVKIVWEAAYGTAYVVQISADAVNWQPMKTVSGNSTLVNDWTGLIGSGRYVRIYGTARNSQWGYSIFELEVYGTSGPVAPTFIVASESALSVAPNPTADFTKIYVDAEVSGKYSVIVYNKTGVVVDILVDGFLDAGRHDFELNLSQVASDVYFIKLVGNGKEEVTRLQKQ